MPPGLLRRLASCGTFVAAAFLSLSTECLAQEVNRQRTPLSFELEMGGAFPTVANAQGPASDEGSGAPGGTPFSLTRDLNVQPDSFGRGRLGVAPDERHLILALVAPLAFESRGVAPFPVAFHSLPVAKGDDVLARLRLNAYRFSYRYLVIPATSPGDRISLAVGGGINVARSILRLEAPFGHGELRALAVTPIASLRLAARLVGPLSLVVDAEGLAHPWGHSEDVLAAAHVRVAEMFAFSFGYRLLAGRTRNDELVEEHFLHMASNTMEFAF